MHSFTILLLLLSVISYSHGKPPTSSILGALRVDQTVGQPWPLPQTFQTTNQKLGINPAAFHFLVNATGQTCDLLTSAFDRYYRMIFFPESYLDYILNPGSIDNKIKHPRRKHLAHLADVPLFMHLDVLVRTPCDQYPTLESDESCKRKRILFFSQFIFLFLKIHLLLVVIVVHL
jgi:hypothetical protein